MHELFLFLTPRLASALRWLRGRDGLGQSASMHLPSTPPLYGCDLTLHWRDLPTCVCSHRILIAARRRGCAKAEGLWPASRICIAFPCPQLICLDARARRGRSSEHAHTILAPGSLASFAMHRALAGISRASSVHLVPRVCRRCNSDWMAAAEREARQRAGN